MSEQSNKIINISLGKNIKTTNLTNCSIAWEEFKSYIKQPKTIAVLYNTIPDKKHAKDGALALTHEQAIEQAVSNAKSQLEYFIGGKFEPAIRNAKNIQSRSVVVLDVDKYNGSIQELEKIIDKDLEGFEYIAYSTASYTSECPSVRIVLPVEEEIPTNLYKNVVTNFVGTLTLNTYVDIQATATPSQAMYLPAIIEITQQPPDKPKFVYEYWHKESITHSKLFDYRKYLLRVDLQLAAANENGAKKTGSKVDKRKFPKNKVYEVLEYYHVENLNYQEWLEAGMAIHHYFEGSAEGLAIWNEWSSQDTREGQYNKEELIKKYNSFDANAENTITIATISRRASLANVEVIDETILKKSIAGTEYILTKDSLYALVEKKDELGNAVKVPTKISNYIELKGQGTNSIGHRCFVMSILDRDKNYRDIFLPLVAKSETLKQYLLDAGLIFNPERFNFLVKYILANRTDNQLEIEYRLGWNAEQSCYNLMTKKDGLKSYYVDKSRNNKKSVLEFKLKDTDLLYQRGTLEEWQDNIAQYAFGNTNIAFALYTAFSPIFLTPLNRNGVVMHFFGNSSIGKTIMLSVAATVWGESGAGYRSWHGTINSFENLGLQKNDSLLCMDELTALQGKHTIATAPYLLINGQVKNRADSKGEGFGGRAKKTWITTVLSTGETTFESKMRSVDEELKGGQTVRFIDIPALRSEEYGVFEELHGFNTSKELAHHLSGSSYKYKGTAIEDFLDYIFKQNDFYSILKKIEQERQTWLAKYLPEGATSQVERVAEVFSVIAAAGEVAIASGALPEKYGFVKGQALEDVATIFGRWLEQLGDYTVYAEEKVVKDRLCSFFYKHQANGFYSHKRHGEEANNSRVVTQNVCVGIYGRASEGSGKQYSAVEPEEYYPFKYCLENEALQGLNVKESIKIMRRHGYIHLNSGNRSLYSKYYTRDKSSVSCYLLNLRKLGIVVDVNN